MKRHQLHLSRVCEHLLVRPDLLTDTMYQKQVRSAIVADENSYRELEAACAELLSFATLLKMEIETIGGHKMPPSWHAFNARDHQPENRWGMPILQQINSLKQSLQECADWLCECEPHTDQWERGQHARALLSRLETEPWTLAFDKTQEGGEK